MSAKPRPATIVESAASPVTLPLAVIRAGVSQPRLSLQPGPLEELAASIRANGVIQPIVVRPLAHAPDDPEAGSRYEIVAGERRWQAAKLAGLAEIPVVIRELSDRDAVAVALIENIQREELTPAEEARALQRLIGEFSLTHQAVADAVGRSRAAVSNLIRLLDLPAAVVALIDAKAISMGHARALLGLESEAARTRLGQMVAERGLSVRETENLVRKAQGDEGRAVSASVKVTDSTVVSEILRTTAVHVQLHQKAAGSGKLVVEFADPEVRDAIVAAIQSAVAEG